MPDDVLLSRAKVPTIIGAEAFHGPVRDGKEWDHLAMVIRHRRQVVSLHPAWALRYNRIR